MAPATRLAHQPACPHGLQATALHKLAQLVGVACTYVGQDGTSYDIDDRVLERILTSFGYELSAPGAIEQAIQQIQDERHARVIAASIAHTCGTEQRVPVVTSASEVPWVRLTLEEGYAYGSPLRIESAPGVAPYMLGSKLVTTSYVVIPADVPVGYHTLHVHVGQQVQVATLLCAPACMDEKGLAGLAGLAGREQGECEQSAHSEPSGTESSGSQPHQQWGWMIQLYSIRSAQSWGVGDYEDLAQLLTQAYEQTGADFILVNPLNASSVASPLLPSPYMPSSRQLPDCTYIRPERITEYEQLSQQDKAQIAAWHGCVEPFNGDTQIIDRDMMWEYKRRALELIYREFQRSASVSRREQFADFCKTRGHSVDPYALWCVCCEQWGTPPIAASGEESSEASSEFHPEQSKLGMWAAYLRPDSEQVMQLSRGHAERIEFYRWLVFNAHEQLCAAQQAAKQAGMRIGIIADMPVGVHPFGADVWGSQTSDAAFVSGVCVGAPPDYFNQQGQNWSQPPLNPLTLERTGYQAYRAMIHAMFTNAGAVRIDHILGAFRLWWIAQGDSASQGAYVYYDAHILLNIVMIEAQRAGGLIIGEDLGVVPPYVEKELKKRGLLGCTVAWFQQHDGVFSDPTTWRQNSLVCVDTHDMPPADGYLSYEHVTLRQRLHLLTSSADEFRAAAQREQEAMLAMLVRNGLLPSSVLSEPTITHSEHCTYHHTRALADVAAEGASRWQCSCDMEAARKRRWMIIKALHRALCLSPGRLLAVNIADAVGESRSQNLPGTDNEYPNWRIPLADSEGSVIEVASVFSLAGMRELARIMNEGTGSAR